MKHKIAFFFLLILWPFAQQAQDVVVSFQQLLSDGFENNYNIKLETLSLEKSEYTIMRAGGFLNPFFDSEVVYGSGVDPTITYNGTRYAQTNFVLPTKWGVNFYSGARVERSFLIDNDFMLNSAGAWVGVSLPLLRGLGKNSNVNTFIKTSELNKKALEEQLSNEVITYFRDILMAFLSLKKNETNARITQEALGAAKKYREDINILTENDILPKVENNRAEALFTQRKQQHTNAVLEGVNSFFNVKLLTGTGLNRIIDTLPQLTDEIPNPDIDFLKKYIAERKGKIDTLIKNTPQYKNISYRIEEDRQLLANAKNQKHNPLDLDAKVSKFGMYPHGVYNLNNALNSNYPGYSVLLTLTHRFPITNQQQRGAYQEQLTTYETTKTYLDQYVFETKMNSERLLNNLNQMLSLYRQTERVADILMQTYKDEQEKFKFGSATQIDVILSFDNYYDALITLNTLKYDLYNTFVQIKLLLGELPDNQEAIIAFSFMEFFTKN